MKLRAPARASAAKKRRAQASGSRVSQSRRKFGSTSSRRGWLALGHRRGGDAGVCFLRILCDHAASPVSRAPGAARARVGRHATSCRATSTSWSASAPSGRRACSPRPRRRAAARLERRARRRRERWRPAVARGSPLTERAARARVLRVRRADGPGLLRDRTGRQVSDHGRPRRSGSPRRGRTRPGRRLGRRGRRPRVDVPPPGPRAFEDARRRSSGSASGSGLGGASFAVHAPTASANDRSRSVSFAHRSRSAPAAAVRLSGASAPPAPPPRPARARDAA